MNRASALGTGVFLLVGVLLLAAAGWWAYAGVYVPMTWPRTAAEVMSSRVINTAGPQRLQPELVFRYDAAGTTRERLVVPNWSSGSYELVRQFVDRYPAGRQLPVGVNPVDPDDIAYELAWSFDVLLGPVVVATLGLVFAGIGLFLRKRSTTPLAGALTTLPRTARRAGWASIAIGAVLLATGAWLFRGDAAMRRDWGVVSAEVVSAEVTTSAAGVSSGRQQRGRLFDSRIAFRYVVDGRPYTNATTYGVASSDQNGIRARIDAFAPGTTHTIRYRPDDPNIIRFDLEDWWATFGLSFGLMVLGAVFLTMGGVIVKVFRA